MDVDFPELSEPKFQPLTALCAIPPFVGDPPSDGKGGEPFFGQAFSDPSTPPFGQVFSPPSKRPRHNRTVSGPSYFRGHLQHHFQVTKEPAPSIRPIHVRSLSQPPLFPPPPITASQAPVTVLKPAQPAPKKQSRRRGSYRCRKCGQIKKGHVCKVSSQQVDCSVQAELDSFLTVRAIGGSDMMDVET